MSSRRNRDSKFPTTKLPVQGKIKVNPAVHADPDIRFSFKHLDLSHDKFCVKTRDAGYFNKVLERLKNLSSVKMSELLENRSSALRAHPIDWIRTSEPNGFDCLNAHYRQLSDQQPYQFEISANEHGRVHGFILDDIFFVVWLDPDHLLFP